MFDVTPVTTGTLTWAALTFAAAYGALHLAVSKHWLRAVRGQARLSYAGTVVVAVTILFAAALLQEEPVLLAGLVAAGCVVILAGSLDEGRRLHPWRQLIFQAAAAACAVAGGWTIRYISQPGGEGVIAFTPWLGALLAIAWLLLLMNAMNWLDGVDGLAGGVGTVALLTLAAVSLLPSVQDSLTLGLSLIGAAALGGFLVWNWPPARVYLGTSGSWWLGLFIGLVAIGGGGKIVTTLLVLALPVVDVLVVAVSRLLARQPLWQGDQVNHLHHRLLRRDVSPRAITIGAILISAALGVGAIVLQTEEKITALLAAAALIAVAATALALPLKGRRRSWWLPAAAVVAAVIAASLVSRAPAPCRNFTEGEVVINNSTWSVAVADTQAEHSRGLMECEALPAGTGMYFVFEQPTTQPFWMKNMRIPLDIVWIQDNTIIAISADVPPAGDTNDDPPLYHAPYPYTAVLELPAGAAAEAGLAIGQETSLETQ